jgi:hypothetical protein
MEVEKGTDIEMVEETLEVMKAHLEVKERVKPRMTI